MRYGTRILRQFAIFTVAAAVLTIFGYSLSASAQSTDVSVGVGDTVLEITGQSSPGAFVTFVDDGSIIGTATADAQGVFIKTFIAYTPGIHQIRTYARDSADHFTDIVSSEINVTEHFQTNLNVFLPPTVTIAQPSVQAGQLIELNGETAPNAVITVTLDNIDTFQATADVNGEWSLTLSTAYLRQGQHSFYAASTLAGGSQSQPTNAYIFIIQPTSSTPAPQAGRSLPFPQARPRPLDPPVITSPSSGQRITQRELTVRGTAAPGVKVELYNGSRLIGAAFVDQNGNWEITMTLTLPMYELKARVCRVTSCSEFSKSTLFYYDTGPGQSDLRAYLDTASFIVKSNQSMNLELHVRGGLGPYKVMVDWGDGHSDTVETHQLDSTIAHTYVQSGKYSGTVIVYDKNGSRYLLTFAVRVEGDRQIPLLVIIFILILIIIILWLLWRRHEQHIKRTATTRRR